MQIEVGAVLEGKVTGITKFGAFVEIAPGKTGMVHISEVANSYVKEITDHISEGQTVKVKVLSIGEDGKISLSIKKATAPAPRTPRAPVQSSGRPGNFEWQSSSARRTGSESFEDMMSRFKQASDEKMSDLRRSVDGKHGSFAPRRGSNKPQP
ncbi:MAG: S1 RNA-binding domain-containing protein [Ruminococcaceae bacterium]|nr:S1 RNA-binding domain-containing protein [Oscillospiraceae bacterium]